MREVVLFIKIVKEFVGNDVFPGEMISIEGNTRTSGFAMPFSPEKFSSVDVDAVIKDHREYEARMNSVSVDSVKVKIVEDFRQQGLTRWLA